MVLDADLLRETKRQMQARAQRWLVGHHVEGYAVARGVDRTRAIYVAHTDLEGELASYFSPHWRAPLGWVGRAIDQVCTRSAQRVGAVSPALTAQLARRFGREVVYLPIPWHAEAPAHAEPRPRADAQVLTLLYVGNLDRYQGWEDLVAALGRLHAEGVSARLQVCTASDTAPLLALAYACGVRAQVLVRRLHDEASRAAAYASSDVVVIPRRVGLGVPVKMLDALTRGLPVVAYDNATGGLPIERCVRVVAPDAEALSACLKTTTAISDDVLRRRADYLRQHHSRQAFVDAWQRLTR